jgi:hypothetical protein
MIRPNIDNPNPETNCPSVPFQAAAAHPPCVLASILVQEMNRSKWSFTRLRAYSGLVFVRKMNGQSLACASNNSARLLQAPISVKPSAFGNFRANSVIRLRATFKCGKIQRFVSFNQTFQYPSSPQLEAAAAPPGAPDFLSDKFPATPSANRRTLLARLPTASKKIGPHTTKCPNNSASYGASNIAAVP